MDRDPDAWRFREYAEGHTSDSPVDLSGREGAPREPDDEDDVDTLVEEELDTKASALWEQGARRELGDAGLNACTLRSNEKPHPSSDCFERCFEIMARTQWMERTQSCGDYWNLTLDFMPTRKRGDGARR